MSSVWREVDAELRRSRAQTHLAGAAYGVRDWLSDLDAGRPLLAAIDAMPDAPDVRALLKPFQDSALTRFTEARATGKAEALVAESRNTTAEQTSRPVRRVSAATRFADDSHAVRYSSTPPGVHAATAANMPARVAALLARHEHVRRLVAEDGVQRAPWSDPQRSERRVVPFAGHRAVAGESVPRSQGNGSATFLTAVLARWGEVAATEPSQRLEAATGRALAASERAQLDASRASLSFDPAALPMRGAPAALERSALASTPALPPAIVRLDDLAAPALPQDRQRAHASPPPVQAAGDAARAPLPPAATGESVLGRMAGALARIEERLAESKPSAEPRTQWLTEDDNLAERIHDILRRQALRHGIDAP